MASMQAYLLNYKEDPRLAVEQAGEWAKSATKNNLMLASPVKVEVESVN